MRQGARTGYEGPMRQVSWLGVVRHGESTGNVAARSADRDGLDRIDLADRDADVPLSDDGRDQAAALGRWLAELPEAERPDVAMVSPYLRARQTAEIALDGLGVEVHLDERLRDRELGVLDLLTTRGVESTLPDEAERRRRLGKFYYRPPGGESWADVLHRLRSALRDIDEEHAGRRVLVVAHDVVVTLIRSVVEEVDEPTLMEQARRTVIANCSVTSWVRGDAGWEPEHANAVGHLERDPEAEPTAEPSTEDEAEDGTHA